MKNNLSFVINSNVPIKEIGSLCMEIGAVEGVDKAVQVFPENQDPILARIGMLEILDGYKPQDILDRVKVAYADKLESIGITAERYFLKDN
ncbi:MAG TPA: hypothetical protein VJI98_01175 [Candidatus Nanoarchaeia archaeon]|nr:hypothetical protein [Candidatus Nanoarchaeia archaeon]